MQLEGKIINFLGDSITEGYGVSDVENNRYDNIIKKKCNLKAANNYGISGTRIARQCDLSTDQGKDLCFCKRVYDLAPEADITVVFGGTNDYGHGDALFGNPDDKTPDTFCGAVDFLMRVSGELYPDMKFIFMTPAHRQDDEYPSDNHLKRDKFPLKRYVDIIKLKGEEYNIPVLDLYEDLGLNPNDEQVRAAYAPDGLHYNDKGQEVIADCLIEFIKKL